MSPSTPDDGAAHVQQGFEALRSASVPPGKKFLIGLAMLMGVAYTLSPVDFIPDAIPIAGTADDLGAMMPGLIMLLNTIKRNMQPGMTTTEKLLLLTGVVYTLSPVDLIPDAIPFIGTADDLGVLLTVTLPTQLKKRREARAV